MFRRGDRREPKGRARMPSRAGRAGTEALEPLEHRGPGPLRAGKPATRPQIHDRRAAAGDASTPTLAPYHGLRETFQTRHRAAAPPASVPFAVPRGHARERKHGCPGRLSPPAVVGVKPSALPADACP
jgi:hypothetical protein